MQCKFCLEDLPKDGDFATCSVCMEGMHFKCSPISGPSWRSLSNHRKDTWRCVDCRTKSTQEMANDPSTPEASSELEKLLDKKFKDFKMEIKLEIQERFKEVRKSMEDKLREMERGLEFVGEKMEELTKANKEMQRKLVVVEQNQGKLEDQTKELRTRVHGLELTVHQMEQEKHANKLEISGVPENIDCQLYVGKVLEKCRVNPMPRLDQYVVVKHNHVNTTNTTKSLTVIFESEKLRDTVWTTIKREKPKIKTGDISAQGPSTEIYINEYLSPYYKRVFYEAKKIKKDKQYKFLWVQNGRILLKKTQESKIMRIASLNDLGKM